MKPLTIDELKALPFGDWVWVVLIDKDFDFEMKTGYYQKISEFNYSDYGTAWLAYKNKEQAEALGEIVELPRIEPFSTCNIETGEPCTCYNILYRDKASGEFAIDCEVDKSEAERRLAELRGEK